jgi:hypothetical protein
MPAAKALRLRAASSTIHSPNDTDRTIDIRPWLGPSRRGATHKQADDSITTLDEEDAITDQPNPHDQHDSELQLVLTIGIEGFRELVSWVAEGTTAEDRHTRTAIRQRSTKHFSTRLRGSGRRLSDGLCLSRRLEPAGPQPEQVTSIRTTYGEMTSTRAQPPRRRCNQSEARKTCLVNDD